MSHIRAKEELLKLKEEAVKIIDSDENSKLLSSFCSLAVPKYENGKGMVGVVVDENSMEQPGYVPSKNIIYIPSNTFFNLSEDSAKSLSKVFEYENIDKLKKFYEIFGLLHEVEHAYQFLISDNKVQFPYVEVKDGYKRLISFLYGGYSIVRHPILAYKSNKAFNTYNMFPYDFILERNANVEAANDTSIIANELGEDGISEIFDSLVLSYLNFGYENDNLGCMYHTFKTLLPRKEYDKIKKDDNITEDERMRFGLKISQETHKKLEKKMENSRLIL